MILKHKPSLEILNASGKNTLVEHLGIELKELGENFLVGTMPVDHRTKQPMGLLHGGASVVLAETLGSIASTLIIEDLSRQAPVGIEINANHLRSAQQGVVTGRCTALKIGRKLHVWNIEIKDENDKLICTSRLTTMVIDRS